MNDFLKNLRSNSKDKRYNQTNRKNYNSNYGNNYNSHHGGGNRNVNGNIKKSSYNRSQEQDKFYSLLGQSLPEVKEQLQKMADAQDRRARAEERKAAALEDIARILMPHFSSAVTAASAAVSSSPLSETIETEAALPEVTNEKTKKVTVLGREEVLKIIFDMREGGATFGEIASHLEDRNIPTFSGKGKWHAQTIHRVCHVS